MDRKTQKVGLGLVATALAVSLLLVAFRPTVVSAAPASYTPRVPIPYSQMSVGFMQMFVMFPQFEANNLHYNNPWLGGPGQEPLTRATLHADIAYVKESATVAWENLASPGSPPNWQPIGGTLQLKARHLTLWLGFPPLPPLFEASGESVTFSMSLEKPTSPDDEYGRIDAKFIGNVRFHIPALPGSPFPEFHYEGPQLTVSIVFYEPPAPP